MVDKDFDEPSQYIRYQRLVFTDTHDLETVMLSTDTDLQTRIDGCAIDRENIKKALFLAYQLAQYRMVIFNEGTLDPKWINEADGTVDYQLFSTDIFIDLERLLSLINGRQTPGVSAAKLSKINRSIVTKMRKYVDGEGRWKKSFDNFEIDQRDEFWMITNGHDILSAIRFICHLVNVQFQNTGMFRRNMSFELALSDKYDFRCFQITDLSEKLLANSLIVSV